MQQAVFQTAIQVKQLVTADQSNSFAPSVISDVERGPVCKRKEKVNASPQTGSIRICKPQTCAATIIIIIIIIIILTDAIDHILIIKIVRPLANVYSGSKEVSNVCSL